jgi:LuxR family maltose regulon positive regulatory protein
VRQKNLYSRTKLSPPRLHKHTLRRPRVTGLLLDSDTYRLTLVQAGTGYGKSTALATLAEEVQPLAWYHLAAEDADPVVFLVYLYYAFNMVLPDLPDTALASLEEWERDRHEPLWTGVVDVLLSTLSEAGQLPVTLVIDDAHLLNSSAESLRILDRFIGRSTYSVHTILVSRHAIDLPSMVSWRVRGSPFRWSRAL